jgi:hypothetical protein
MGQINPLATISKQRRHWLRRFRVVRVMFTRPCGVFEDGTYSEWLCAAVGAARLERSVFDLNRIGIERSR